MPYATRQDLIDRFGELELVQLTDRENVPPSTIDDTVVDGAIADATGFIDGYLRKVYALPLASVPANLVKLTADVARFYLHGKAAEKDSPVAIAYGQAQSWLRDVSKGLVQLDVDGSAAQAAPGSAGRVTGSDPVFTRHTLSGF